MPHNLILRCTEPFKTDVSNMINRYLGSKPALQERASARIRKSPAIVVIKGDLQVRAERDDTIKEVAETILFECGNVLKAIEQSAATSTAASNTPILQVGRDKSDIEASQGFELWQILAPLYGELSDYGKRQVDHYRSMGRIDAYQENFATSVHATSVFTPKVRDAGYDPRNRCIYVDVGASTSSGEPMMHLSSGLMYTYTTLKDASSTGLTKIVKQFSPEVGWENFVDNTFFSFSSGNKGDHVIAYCIMCQAAILGWGADSRALKLPTGIIQYALADREMSKTLNLGTKKAFTANFPDDYPNVNHCSKTTLLKLANNSLISYAGIVSLVS